MTHSFDGLVFWIGTKDLTFCCFQLGLGRVTYKFEQGTMLVSE